MTPAEYESRCAEMLRMNAHNMSAGEIERFARCAGDGTLARMAGMAEDGIAALDKTADLFEKVKNGIDDARYYAERMEKALS